MTRTNTGLYGSARLIQRWKVQLTAGHTQCPFSKINNCGQVVVCWVTWFNAWYSIISIILNNKNWVRICLWWKNSNWKLLLKYVCTQRFLCARSHVYPVKTQISLRIRAVWSFSWRSVGSQRFKASSGRQRRLWWACVDTHVYLSLC